MLIRNKKIALIKNFILLVLVVNFSTASFIVHSVKKEDCCHAPKQEVKPMSCCEEMMKIQTTQEECSTTAFTFENILPDCGCFHDFTPNQQTLQIVKTQELTKVEVIAELSNEWTYENTSQRIANRSLIENTESPPIYLTVSSFLI